MPFVKDDDLIRQARAGTDEAWNTIVTAHQEPVFRLSYLILGDPDDAADNAQETFLRARRFISRYDTARPLQPWLLGIAGNLAKNRLRAAGRYLNAIRRWAGMAPTPRSTAGQVDQAIEQERLWEAIRRLSPADQQVIYLRYYLDLPVRETAEALEVAEGTIKSRLSRALERLRTVVERDYPDLEIA